MARLEIVGGGRMGEALVGGLLAAGWAPAAEVRVVEPRAERRLELADRFPGLDVAEAPAGADGVVLAVKPGEVAAVAAGLDPAAGTRVLSIAAGVTVATLEAALPPGTPVVRAMPNTPALVGAGASAIAPGTSAGPEDLDWAEGVLAAVGLVVRVTEAQLDAVTGVSGSGPAYLFLLAEAMVEAGVREGLPRDVATALAGQTVLGAGRLLVEGDEDAAGLRAAVTSPGGTTAAALAELERGGVRASVLDAVRAASERARQLGQG